MNSTVAPGKSTSERILAAAEELFATQGIRGTSLKEITDLAGVNIAAVNYHFRTKDALVRAVYEKSFQPLNQERLRLLDAAEEAAGDRALPIEAVLRALFEPMMRAWQSDRHFILLVGRLQSEPDPHLSGFVQGLYGGLIQRFLDAAVRAAPDIDEGQLFFWVHFLFGGVVYTLLNSQDMKRMHHGQNLIDTPEEYLSGLISFGASGLQACRNTRPTPACPPPERAPGRSKATTRRKIPCS